MILWSIQDDNEIQIDLKKDFLFIYVCILVCPLARFDGEIWLVGFHYSFLLINFGFNPTTQRIYKYIHI